MQSIILKSNSNVIILPDIPASSGTTVYSAVSLPPNLSVDRDNGIIYGYLTTQTEYQKNYTVTATATTTFAGTIVTATNTKILSVRGGSTDVISWISDKNLGSITAGIASNLSIHATHTETSGSLTYNYGSMVQASFTTTAMLSIPGLSLSTAGDITGTATATGTYHFEVIASTGTYYSQHYPNGPTYPYPYIIDTFQLTVISPETACTNIYLEPLLAVEKRKEYTSFITNTSTFNHSWLYRADDPNFGVQPNIRMGLAYGIQQLTLDQYSIALTQNFSPRRFRLSGPKVAVATDADNNVLYEAVYLDVIDDQVGSAQSVNINELVIYPASIDNMRARLIQPSTIIDPRFTPRFLYTDGEPVYRPVMVLCYAVPSYGGRIVRNILKTMFDFGTIDFDIDRILIENSIDNTQPSYLLFPRSI